MEANLNRTQTDPPSAGQSAPTAAGTDQNTVPNYPKELYDEALIEDEHRNFNLRLREAHQPKVSSYVAPPVPPAIAAVTALEMAAGKARVEHFEGVEKDRQGIAARTKEKWEGDSKAVFRPADFEEYKPTLKSSVQTQSKDVGLRQPTPRS